MLKKFIAVLVVSGLLGGLLAATADVAPKSNILQQSVRKVPVRLHHRAMTPVQTDVSKAIQWGSRTAPPEPQGCDTLYYDDGSAANAYAYYEGGNGFGVKFVAPGNATIYGALMYFWGTDWPVPGSDNAGIRVYDNDGTGGLPGTVLYEDLSLTITRGAWNYIALSSPVTESNGDGVFYVFYIQVGDYPNVPGLGIDAAVNVPGTQWDLIDGVFSESTEGGDWLIRADVCYETYDHDVGAMSVDAPLGLIPAGEAVTPVATFKNLGANSETFTAYFEIPESRYLSSRSITLNPGEEQQVTFDSWTPAEGDYTLYAYSALSGDENPANDSAEGSCTAVIAGNDYILINLDPTPGNGEDLNNLLIANGLHGFYTTSSAYINADSLSQYNTAWIVLGIYSNNYQLSDAEANAISDYLNAGGSVYLEGGDCFGFDPTKTIIDPLFGIDPGCTDDGSADLTVVTGISNSYIPDVAGHTWNYNGENNWIDRLCLYASPPYGGVAEGFLYNQSVGYNTGVAYDNGTWKGVAVSHELAENVPATRQMSTQDLVMAIYNFLVTSYEHDVGATAIVSPPSGPIDPGDYNVTVHLINTGDNDETFDVTAYIEDTVAATIVWGPYTESVSLSAGTATDHTFSSTFTAEQDKHYHVVAYTSLSGDENPGNDTTESYCRTALSVGDIIQVIQLDVQDNSYYHVGVEFDGHHFYVTDGANAAGGQNHIYIYDSDGNLVDSLSQPTSGWGWRDMALDCAHVSGVHNMVDTLFASVSPNVDMFGIDFSTMSLNNFGSFSGPENPNRALAYDCINGFFYTANFSSPIYQFTRTNPMVQQWSNLYAIYGAAYEPCTKKVWFSTQESNSYGNDNILYEFDPVTGTYTGNMIEMPSAIGATGEVAGGLTFWGNYNGYRVLIELVQADPDYIAVIYLGPAYHCGDLNGDDQVSFTDLQYLASYLFSGGAAPVCDITADVNGDGSVSFTDLQYLSQYLFAGGNPPNCACCAKYW